MIAKACWYPIGLSEEQMDHVVSLNDQLGDISVSSIVGYEQKTWKAMHGKLSLMKVIHTCTEFEQIQLGGYS